MLQNRIVRALVGVVFAKAAVAAGWYLYLKSQKEENDWSKDDNKVDLAPKKETEHQVQFGKTSTGMSEPKVNVSPKKIVNKSAKKTISPVEVIKTKRKYVSKKVVKEEKVTEPKAVVKKVRTPTIKKSISE